MKILIAGLVILLIFGVIGAYMGALRIVFSMIFLVVTLAVSCALMPKVSGFLGGDIIKLDQRIQSNVNEILDRELGGRIDAAEEKLQEEALKTLHLPASWQREIMKKNSREGMEAASVNTFSDLASKVVGRNCFITVSFFLLWLLLSILIRLLVKLLHLVELFTKLPILKQANKFTGFWMGMVLGVLALSILLTILPAFQQFSSGQRLINMLNENWVTSFIYRHNLWVWILSRI